MTHILTVAQGIAPKFPSVFTYKLISILDAPSANLKQYFQSCIAFIKDAINSGGTVLVHCFAGVSRSASIVIAYLMQEHGMSYPDAMQHVKRQRYFICPNDGFKRQLMQFNRELKKIQTEKTTSTKNNHNKDEQEGVPQDYGDIKKQRLAIVGAINNSNGGRQQKESQRMSYSNGFQGLMVDARSGSNQININLGGTSLFQTQNGNNYQVMSPSRLMQFMKVKQNLLNSKITAKQSSFQQSNGFNKMMMTFNLDPKQKLLQQKQLYQQFNDQRVFTSQNMQNSNSRLGFASPQPKSSKLVVNTTYAQAFNHQFPNQINLEFQMKHKAPYLQEKVSKTTLNSPMKIAPRQSSLTPLAHIVKPFQIKQNFKQKQEQI